MKKNLICAAISAVIMLALPWCAVKFIQGDGGMAVCFILFFAVDPLTAAASGVFAGRDVRKRWFQPLLTAALFLAGTWLLFDPGETAFLLYAGIYLAVGCAAMAAARLVKAKRAR